MFSVSQHEGLVFLFFFGVFLTLFYSWKCCPFFCLGVLKLVLGSFAFLGFYVWSFMCFRLFNMRAWCFCFSLFFVVNVVFRVVNAVRCFFGVSKLVLGSFAFLGFYCWSFRRFWFVNMRA